MGNSFNGVFFLFAPVTFISPCLYYARGLVSSYSSFDASFSPRAARSNNNTHQSRRGGGDRKLVRYAINIDRKFNFGFFFYFLTLFSICKFFFGYYSPSSSCAVSIPLDAFFLSLRTPFRVRSWKAAVGK
ncbi:hypothetical protein F4804DRAFT_202685 [Jackrogersella minutella]|nr:hypothetical protein F4804DRAFT_202685 [Jackrogersella minutella]